MTPTPAAAAPEDPGLAKAWRLADRAEGLMAAGRIDPAVASAREAVGQAAGSARPWEVLARALEAQGDLTGALAAYTEAASRAEDLSDRGWSLGRTALRLGEYAAAEALLAAHLEAAPPTEAVIAALARAQAGQRAFDQARETLRAALEADAVQPRLWLALGQILAMEGRHTEAVIFLEEALRLDPDSVVAKSALADSLLLGLGDTARAVELGEQALAAAAPEDRAALTAAQARRRLAAGRLAEGWTALAAGAEPGDARLIEPRIAAPRWTPGMKLSGRLVLVGEESLADELLLAHLIPTLIGERLPLTLAVHESWGNLARRSFPSAMVTSLKARGRNGQRQLAVDLDSPHVHGQELVSAWAPLRAMAATRRATPGGFANPRPWLKPDLDRVAHWRTRLSEAGPALKIGLAWRTPVGAGMRAWELLLLSYLAGPLSTPGLALVSLEPQEIFGELDVIRETYGLALGSPPELNRADLDDLAALACAVDIVIGPPDVPAWLAAACGAETWIVSPPGHWAQLGTGSWPWFPKARAFQAAASDDWAEVIGELGAALAERAQP